MLKNKQGVKSLHIDGQRTTGLELRQGNVRACSQLANMMKSSFGPQGLDKMLVDNVGGITITNDGATILEQLQVEHPAAQVMVRLARTTDHQAGDGTTSVVILSAELLKAGLRLIENDKIHATNVIEGFRLACDEALRFIDEKLILDSELTPEITKALIGTVMSSKVLGTTRTYFSELVYQAISSVQRGGLGGKKVKYPIKLINIVKKHGKSMKESRLVEGYCIGDPQCRICSMLMPRRVEKAKIALVDFNLHKVKLKLGIEVDVNDPDELQKIKAQESEVIKKRIDLILKAGANVIFTTKGIDALCSSILFKNGAIGIRRCPKQDIRRLAELTGASLITDLTNLEGEEQFTEAELGYADVVNIERVSDDDMVFVRGCKQRKTSSIVLRGANDYLLDEMDRTIHDALMAAKKVMESKKVVCGGGVVEGAVSIYLEDFARKIETREQLAISEFAEALLVIPKTLAINAALDSTELIAKLRSYHFRGLSQKDEKDEKDKIKTEFLHYGLDLENNDVCDVVKKGILEPAVVKKKIIKFATEAAITILRIDDMFRLNPKPKPKDRRR